MLFAPQARDTVERTLRAAKTQAEAARMAETERRLDMLHDDWRDHVLAVIFSRYNTEDYRQQLATVLTTEHNVLKRIITELSTVYKWGATRELDDPKQNEIYKRLCDEMQIDEVLELANAYVNAARDLIVVPKIIAGRYMRLDLYAGDTTRVVQDDRDPASALAWHHESGLVDTPSSVGEVSEYADHERFVWTDQYGRELGARVHGMGRLPGVVVHASPRIDAFWGISEGSDIADSNIEVAHDLAMIRRITMYQSELQPTYNGDPSELATKKMAMGARSMWMGKGVFGSVDLQAEVERYWTGIKHRVGLIANCYGLAADVYDLSASGSSGFSIRLKRAPLEAARVKQLKTWRRVEKDLLSLVALVSQDHPTLRLDPMRCQFKELNFHEEPMLEDPLTQNRVWTERKALGLTTRARILREMDPDLSHEQAKKRVEEIVTELAKEGMFERDLNMPADPTKGPGKSPQENGRDGGKAKADGNGLRAAIRKALRGESDAA